MEIGAQSFPLFFPHLSIAYAIIFIDEQKEGRSGLFHYLNQAEKVYVYFPFFVCI